MKAFDLKSILYDIFLLFFLLFSIETLIHEVSDDDDDDDDDDDTSLVIFIQPLK